MITEYKLKTLSPSRKALIFFFLICLLLGYFIAILKIHSTTNFDISEAILKYKGAEDPELMAFPKTYKEILQLTHSHVFSVPMIYFLLGLIFLGTTLKEKTKVIFISILFSSFLLEYISLWLFWRFSENFVYLTAFSHILSTPCFLYMSIKSLLSLK